MERTIKYAGYIRVSGEEQKREGLSPEYQEKKIREYTQLKEGTLTNIYKDLGKSGGNTERKGFKKLLEAAKKQEFEAIVFTKLDRFSRDIKDIVNTVSELKEQGIKIHSIKENIDTDTPAGKMVLMVLATLAEIERDNARTRTEEILQNKIEEGKPITKPPLGYRYNKNKEWIINEKEANKIKTIFHLRTKNKTAKEINKETGINTRTIYNILKNPTYLGLLQWKETLYPGNHEPIIEESLWIKINKKLPETYTEIHTI